MRLLIKQRVFSWTDTYDVYDEHENRKYYVKTDKKGIYVACGEGVLLLSQVQLEGKKRMEADVFLRGCHIEAGNRFMDKKE